MAEKNAPTEFGEAMHKWIVYGSIGGVGIIIAVLALTGVFKDYIT